MNKHLSFILIVLVAFLVASCAPAAPGPAGPASPASVTSPAAGTTPAARPTVPAPPADGSRPLAKLPPAERANRFSDAAALYIKPGTIYVATFVTAKGNIVAELYGDAVQSVNNFVTLAQNGFYDGLTFHRVEPDFVIQGGDPAGNGSGGPGYTIPAEIKHTHPRGALAWARTGDEVNPQRRSSGSQFYITMKETPFLDGAYTVFGYVIEGMEVADKIAVGDVITRIEISETQVSKLPTPTPTPPPKAPAMEPGRPLAKLPPEQREGFYNTPPAITIDQNKTYQATIESAKGKIVIELNAQAAPVAVNNFVVLANLGFYDNMPVAFMASSEDGQRLMYAIFGSPANSPESDIGYVLMPEPLPGGNRVITGTVSMYPLFDANTGDLLGASGSQFFISFVEEADVQVPLSIIGKVVSGLEVAMKLETGDMVTSITIGE